EALALRGPRVGSEDRGAPRGAGAVAQLRDRGLPRGRGGVAREARAALLGALTPSRPTTPRFACASRRAPRRTPPRGTPREARGREHLVDQLIDRPTRLDQHRARVDQLRRVAPHDLHAEQAAILARERE